MFVIWGGGGAGPGGGYCTMCCRLYTVTLPEYITLHHWDYSKTCLRGPSREQTPSPDRPVNVAVVSHFLCKLTYFDRPPLLKGHFSVAFGVVYQKGFHCISVRLHPRLQQHICSKSTPFYWLIT